MASVVQPEYEESDSPTQSDEDFIAKAKGFSYDTSAADLAQFFAGCDIKGGKHKGIHFIFSRAGKSSEAYIEFLENDDLKRALDFNKKYLGDRYVDVSSVTRDAMEAALAENDSGADPEDSHYIIKLTGMPFSALHEEVAAFFAGCDIKGGKKKGVNFLRNQDGSASGACYVEFMEADDLKRALTKDKEYMGSRFCHVTKSTAEDRDYALAKQNEALQNIKEPIIKLKGLPFKTTDSDIKNFFPDLEIVSLEMVLNEQGNCRGEAFLDFATIDEAKEAIKAYKLKLLHRFVDVTKSSRAEWMQTIPTSEKIKKTAEDLEEPILKLNNLPLKVTKGEIEDFMFGIECRAVQIVRLPRGDCNGEAFVEFTSVEDAAKALKKHKQPLNGESGRDSQVEIVPSSRCDWRKEPLPKTSATTSKPGSARSRSPVTIIRKRPLSLDHSASGERDRHSPHPRISGPVGYPSYGSHSNTSAYGNRSVREYLVNMVGLPFSATEEDVKQFFNPIRMSQIEFLKNNRGLPRGIAVVGFYSEEDRSNAMLRDKNTIGTRYVNLHVRNEPRDYDFDFAKGTGGRSSHGEKRESFGRSRDVTYRDARSRY